MEKYVREGDLYKSVTVFGRTFDLRYGYYEEYEKHSKYNEPIPIYPDLRKEPVYTDDGYPRVTEMQPVCDRYEGNPECEICFGCRHFVRAEELFGICRAENKMKLNNK